MAAERGRSEIRVGGPVCARGEGGRRYDRHMATLERAGDSGRSTHEVLNQAVPLEDYNVFSSDRVLREAVRREGGDFALERIERVGELAGRAETIRWGFEAEEHRPELATHDRFGRRIDEVTFHPSYHELLRLQVGSGLLALPWRGPEPGAHVARAAAFVCKWAAGAGSSAPASADPPLQEYSATRTIPVAPTSS